MLSLRTLDEWGGAEVTINDGATTDTYTVDPAENSAYDAIAALVAWATATFAPTFSWAWSRDSTTSGALLEISATGAFSMTSNGPAQDYFGWSASYGSSSRHTAATAALGTLDPSVQLSIRQSLGVLDDDGNTGGRGVCRSGVPGLSLHPVVVDTVLTALECGRLAHVLLTPAHPRQAWIYQEQSETWRLVALGAVAKSPAAGTLWRVGFDAVGGID